jgi:hypothetical protein
MIQRYRRKKTERRMQRNRRNQRDRRKKRHKMKQRNRQKKTEQPQCRQIDGVTDIKIKSCRISYENTVPRLSFNLESLLQQ